MTENNNRPPRPSKGHGLEASPKMSAKPVKGKLDPETQRKIGQQLRAMYAGVVNEGVPDRFAELINRLDKPDER